LTLHKQKIATRCNYFGLVSLGKKEKENEKEEEKKTKIHN